MNIVQYMIDSLQSPFIDLLLLLLLYVSIIIHELGHLCGGAVAKLHIEQFSVGPVTISREDKLRIHFNMRPKVTSGFVRCYPVHDNNVRLRYIITIAAGPLASLALALCCFTISKILPADNSFQMFLLFSTFTSFVGFAGELIPFRLKGHSSDGAKLHVLFLGGLASERFCAYTRLYGLEKSAIRPREWDPLLVQKATSLSDGSFEHALGSFSAYYWAMDTSDFTRAGQYLEQAMTIMQRKKYPKPFQRQVTFENAFFLAFHRNDPINARRILAPANKSLLSQPKKKTIGTNHLRANVAVLFIEGNYQAAEKGAKNGLAALNAAANNGISQCQKEWFEYILTQTQSSREPIIG